MDAAPHYWAEACAALAKDDVMAAVMAAHPTGFLRSRGLAMETLLRSVVGQQISVKAADAVWRKFRLVTGETLVAEQILGLTDEELRACGFSGQKVKYVRGIAKGFVEGVVHPGLWDGMDDETVIGELVKLPGIGRWTAEMFLMFHVLRPDVLPVADLGLVKGFKVAYAAKFKKDADLKGWQERLMKQAEKWRPYRSVATWYLWRSLDPVEVGY